jgi:hypothetical protein
LSENAALHCFRIEFGSPAIVDGKLNVRLNIT